MAPEWRGESAMQSQSRFFDDLARVAAGAVGTLSELRSEIETRVRDQLERVLSGMDLVSREEFEAVKTMAAKARSEQEDLARRVAELEGVVAGLRHVEPGTGAAAGDPTMFEPPVDDDAVRE
jgi:BMFP domain-containing protein YqiC